MLTLLFSTLFTCSGLLQWLDSSLNLKLRQWPLCFAHLCYAAWADFSQAGAEVEARFDPFLSLTPVAEPHSDHLLLQVETLGYPGYFLRGRFTFLHKAALQSLLSSQAAVWNKIQRWKGERNFIRLNMIEWYVVYFIFYFIYLIVVLLFLFRSFIPILSLYKAAGGKTCCYSSCLWFSLRTWKQTSLSTMAAK